MDDIVLELIHLLESGEDYRGRDTLILALFMIAPQANYDWVMYRLFVDMDQPNWQEFFAFAEKQQASTSGLQRLQSLLAEKGVTVTV